MNRKTSIVLVILLTILMSGTIIIYGKKGEDKSIENIFATKYNKAFTAVKKAENFNLEDGSVGIEGRINFAISAINELESFMNKNDFVQKQIVTTDISTWKNALKVKCDNVYSKLITTLKEIEELDIKDKDQRELMQDKINLGFQYANTIAILSAQDEDEKIINSAKAIHGEYQEYQDAIERVLYNELELARAELTQTNIDTLMSMIPEAFPSDLKGWYIEMGMELQNQLMNEVLKEVGLLYSAVKDNKDSKTIENQKNKIENMLPQFFNSSNDDVKEWANNVKNMLSNIK